MFLQKIDRYSLEFPDPRDATPEGLVAFGGDLNPSRLLLAYRSGIFPWYSSDDPILWWSPNPRLVLFPQDFKISKSLKKRLKSGIYSTKIDTAFRDVIEACANIYREGQDGSWIHRDMIEAYCELHDMGYAHSFEVYKDGYLVGGLYGVSIGSAFFGESMFSRANDASKVALFLLVEKAKNLSLEIIDAQIPTNHLKSLGAIEISRELFLEILESSIKKDGHVGSWSQRLFLEGKETF